MSEPSTPIAAYILAGGKSRRFGSDKARARIAGVPLIRRIAEQLTPLVAQVMVVADRPGKYADLGLGTLVDRVPGLGPIGGLLTALEHLAANGPGDWLVLSSCDLVDLDPALIEQLRREIAPGRGAIAFKDARWQPLPALYHLSILPMVQRAIDAQRPAMWQLLDTVNATAVPLPGDDSVLRQINTPQDHRRAKTDWRK